MVQSRKTKDLALKTGDLEKFFDILEEVIEKEKTTVETVVGFEFRDKVIRGKMDSFRAISHNRTTCGLEGERQSYQKAYGFEQKRDMYRRK